jgi:hypothetical protein
MGANRPAGEPATWQSSPHGNSCRTDVCGVAYLTSRWEKATGSRGVVVFFGSRVGRTEPSDTPSSRAPEDQDECATVWVFRAMSPVMISSVSKYERGAWSDWGESPREGKGKLGEFAVTTMANEPRADESEQGASHVACLRRRLPDPTRTW